ncbi:formate dehydrogenase accessory sulfurtransferase FdhD [Aureimonas jatrophae]|uniref:Sulfur carrier protein FdhD n=1 Tax=Aureimonas jatrophae TaxID=1166073 RepID=A0A1H0GQX0_9HYPH|nr:formate dehydrogenase accessory sulfurtransferase FdhD [Aureimonas jatrophae]MBB3949714.1 FdhD protein [Aureimonas jatrophae]SDO09305.1 FdhD protein [Aureimonas jatrophae]
MLEDPFETRRSISFRKGAFHLEHRAVPQETAIAITVNGTTHAVMMATPADLRDFAFGLILNEGIAKTPADVADLSIVRLENGIDCRIWLTPERAAGYVARRRQMTGPVGCGLCGVDSLALASPDLPPVEAMLAVHPQAIRRAFDSLQLEQQLGRRTRAVHAAGFADADGTLVVVREDVGRHNALDKVAGSLALNGRPANEGLIVVTSRVSVELIQKAARMGSPLLAAVSAPTDLAIRTATALGICLVAVVRGDEFEILTHAHRIVGTAGIDSDAA